MRGEILSKKNITKLARIFNPLCKSIFIYKGKINCKIVECTHSRALFHFENEEAVLKEKVEKNPESHPVVFVFDFLMDAKFPKHVVVLNFWERSHCDFKFYFRYDENNSDISFLTPATLNRPYFIHFISEVPLKNRIKRSWYRLLYNFGLKSLVNDGSFFVQGRLPFWMEEATNYSLKLSKPFSILMVNGEERYPIEYLRIPINKRGGQEIKQEIKTLNFLNTFDMEYLQIPKVKYDKGRLVMTNIKPPYQFECHELTEIHLHALFELYYSSYVEKRLGRLPFWEELIDDLLRLEKKVSKVRGQKDLQLKRVIKSLWRIKEEYSENEKIQVVLANCQFTPEKVFYDKEKLRVFDWRKADNLPLFFDIFHFVLMDDIKNNQSAPHILIDKLENIFWDKNFLSLFSEFEVDWKKCLRFYLLKTITTILINVKDLNQISSIDKQKLKGLGGLLRLTEKERVKSSKSSEKSTI